MWPIRISSGALADGQPSRDLWVSAGHAILVGSVLIQAEKLVNGVTVIESGKMTGALPGKVLRGPGYTQ